MNRHKLLHDLARFKVGGLSSLWAEVDRALSGSTVRNHCQGGRAGSEQPFAGCSLLALLLLLTLFVGVELINATINSKHSFVQLWRAWVEQRGDGKGGCSSSPG